MAYVDLCLDRVKKLERQMHSASISTQSPVPMSEMSRSPVASRVNGLTESVHQRTSCSPLKPSLPHCSDSSSRIVQDSGMMSAFYTFFPNGWEFLVQILHAYYTFLSTLDRLQIFTQIIFNCDEVMPY